MRPRNRPVETLEEIEITPEMIEAGLTAYCIFDRTEDPAEQVVCEIFHAMALASCKPYPQAS